MMPALKMQEVPINDPASRYHFQPSSDKPFVATPAAIEQYGDFFWPCLRHLQSLADEHDGIDYLQISQGKYAQEYTFWLSGREAYIVRPFVVEACSMA